MKIGIQPMTSPSRVKSEALSFLMTIGKVLNVIKVRKIYTHLKRPALLSKPVQEFLKLEPRLDVQSHEDYN